MSRLLIATVGTSLLTNRDERPWKGWDGRRGDALPQEQIVDTWLANCDPVSATAEMNTLRALSVDTSDRILFLHSDTPEGRFCSARLCRYYLQVAHCTEATEQQLSQDVESWLHARPELRPLVEDDTDGHSYLNAAGNLLFQAARERQFHQPQVVVWPAAIARPPVEKNGVSGKEHHRPRGWEQFVERLCSIDCVCRVAYDEAADGGSVVKVLDASSGTLAVRFGSSDSVLPLRVETTAQGEAQTELVAEYIRRRR